LLYLSAGVHVISGYRLPGTMALLPDYNFVYFPIIIQCRTDTTLNAVHWQQRCM